MVDTDSGWDGRGGRGSRVTRNTGGARPAEPIPGRRVAAVSLVALAALATGCEPGAATGAQEAPPSARLHAGRGPLPARTAP